MKNFLSACVLCLLCILSSCGTPSVVQVGRLNMVSNRNVNPNLEYERLQNYAGMSKREIKKFGGSSTIEDAVNRTVRDVPGGEFLMNVKIYLVQGTTYVVEGDVWGTPDNREMKGFEVGDRVQWRNLALVNITGEVVGLIDAQTCMVRADDSDAAIEIGYSRLRPLD